MTSDRSYVERNQQSRARLAELIARLGEDDLTVSLDGGWTVGSALGHMAFWDHFALYRLEQWAREGYRPSSTDADAINAAGLPLWKALSLETAGAEVLAAADLVDRAAAEASDAVIAALAADGRTRFLDRSIHRGAHVDQIDQALADR